MPSGYIEGNQDMLIATNEITTYIGTELANIILLATDDDFEDRYADMLKELEKLGLESLDEYVNQAV